MKSSKTLEIKSTQLYNLHIRLGLGPNAHIFLPSNSRIVTIHKQVFYPRPSYSTPLPVYKSKMYKTPQSFQSNDLGLVGSESCDYHVKNLNPIATPPPDSISPTIRISKRRVGKQPFMKSPFSSPLQNYGKPLKKATLTLSNQEKEACIAVLSLKNGRS